MCYSDPAKSLEIARSRLTPEQWQRFEREFDDFCVVQGLPDKWAYWPTYDWAKWAYFKGRQHGAREVALEMGQGKFTDEYAESYLTNSAAASNDRQRDAKYTRLALAMMTDEQAEASLERWRGVKGEAE